MGTEKIPESRYQKSWISESKSWFTAACRMATMQTFLQIPEQKIITVGQDWIVGCIV